jgi:Flp pilus assembly protein TadD
MLMQFKEFHKASLMFASAITLRRDAPEAYNNLGVALAAQDRFDEAVVQFSRALDLKPDFESAQRNLAEATRRRDAGTTPGTRRAATTQSR